MKDLKPHVYTLSALAGAVGFMLFGAAPAVAQMDKEVIYLDQGWSDEQREYYYNTSQGTVTLPLSLYKFLEQADSQELISAPEFELQNGLVPAEADDKLNPEGLPIGLTTRLVEEGIYKGEWVGFSCAACHNGELVFEDKRIRIDGGTNNNFSMPRYGKVIGDAVAATLGDSAKLDRLAENSNAELGLTRDELQAELEELSTYVNYFNDRIALSPYDMGPGRMDALTQIHNTLLGAYLEIPENLEVTLAPTKSPFLWNTTQSAWVQWSGVLHEPIYRNLGESTGAMARVNVDTSKGEMFESTAALANQIQMERELWSLAPPKWPEAVLGEIDQELAEKGKALADENCAACHTSSPYRWSNPRKKGKVFIENGLIPLEYIGTDAMQFQAPLIGTLPKYIPGKMADYLPQPFKNARTASTGVIQDTMKHAVVAKYLPELDLNEEEYLAIFNYSYEGMTAPGGQNYKAAPLDGMWAAPPYLHNNSVPTIYDLLLPAPLRQPTWRQGRDYDPKKMGLDTSGSPDDFIVDTSLIGLSNAGHSFQDGPLGNGVIGRMLTDEERWAIIEYMKTLPSESGQAAPYGGPENPVNAWEDGVYFNATNKSNYNASGEAGYDANSEKKADMSAEDKQAIIDSAVIGMDQEVIDENDEANITRIREVVLQRMRDTYSDDEVTKRDAHPKTHGMVKAKLVVEKDLPEELRQGIFATETEYDAFVRLSSSAQIVLPDLVQQPHGMAIKVVGVEGPKLLEGGEDAKTQDFVMINAPLFFTGDNETYAEAFEAQVAEDAVAALTEFADANPDVVTAVGKMVSIGGDMNNVFAAQYWSQTPYQLGPYTVKYSARPLSGATNERPDVTLLEYLRVGMEKTISENEVQFEFLVQLQQDPEKQPVENPMVIWEPSEAPEIRVATLVIPKQDISDKADLDAAEDMSFSVWHTLEAHKPLGAINRARRTVYKQAAELRRDENDVEQRAEPTEVPE